jgi:hypothetical protein
MLNLLKLIIMCKNAILIISSKTGRNQSVYRKQVNRIFNNPNLKLIFCFTKQNDIELPRGTKSSITEKVIFDIPKSNWESKIVGKVKKRLADGNYGVTPDYYTVGTGNHRFGCICIQDIKELKNIIPTRKKTA